MDTNTLIKYLAAAVAGGCAVKTLQIIKDKRMQKEMEEKFDELLEETCDEE